MDTQPIDFTGSDIWNVASGYSITKILKPLVLLDDYIKIAEFGAIDLNESYLYAPEIIINRRIQAIKRFCSELITLIENYSFIRKREDYDEVEKLRNKLKKIKLLLKGIEGKTYDQRTNRYVTTINEEHFNNCLDDLRNIKEVLTYYLNRAKLIFPETEEVDIDEIKKRIVESG